MTSFFVKHPPGGDEGLIPDEWKSGFGVFFTINGLGPTEPRSAYEAIRQIEYHLKAFEDHGNAWRALEVFRLCHSAGLYPPLWVLDYINDRFSKAYKEGWTLDRAFGLSQENLGRGKGRRVSSDEEDRLLGRNRTYAKIVFKLEGTGLSRGQACAALAGRLARLKPNERLQTHHLDYALRTKDAISARRLVDVVGSVEDGLDAERQATKEGSRNWTDEEKRRFLEIFREDLPAPVRRRFWG